MSSAIRSVSHDACGPCSGHSSVGAQRPRSRTDCSARRSRPLREAGPRDSYGADARRRRSSDWRRDGGGGGGRGGGG